MLDLRAKKKSCLLKAQQRKTETHSNARAAIVMLLAVRSSLLTSSSQEVSREPSAAKGLGLPSAGGATLSSSDSGCSSLALAGTLLEEEDEAEGAADEEVPCGGLRALLPFACFVPAHFGAAIHLCDGQRGSGIFHWKCIIVDTKVVFSGSANVTQGCLNNWELVFRVVGPKVKVMKDGLEKPLVNAARLAIP